jgi:hypothetical protein
VRACSRARTGPDLPSTRHPPSVPAAQWLQLHGYDLYLRWLTCSTPGSALELEQALLRKLDYPFNATVRAPRRARNVIQGACGSGFRPLHKKLLPAVVRTPLYPRRHGAHPPTHPSTLLARSQDNGAYRISEYFKKKNLGKPPEPPSTDEPWPKRRRRGGGGGGG